MRSLIYGLAVLAIASLPGCASEPQETSVGLSGEPGSTPDAAVARRLGLEMVDARTTPERLFRFFGLVHSDPLRDIGELAPCLDPDFTFYFAEEDRVLDPTLPEFWTKDQMVSAMTNMFRLADPIQMKVDPIRVVAIEDCDPSEPGRLCSIYEVEVDVAVEVAAYPEPITYLVHGPADIAVTQDESEPGKWVIYQVVDRTNEIGLGQLLASLLPKGDLAASPAGYRRERKREPRADENVQLALDVWPSSERSCTPAYASCSAINQICPGSGYIDLIVVLYCYEKVTGVEYELDWGSGAGAEFVSFTSCSDLHIFQETGPTSARVAQTWGDCQTAAQPDPGTSGIGVGWLRLHASGPGRVDIMPPGRVTPVVLDCQYVLHAVRSVHPGFFGGMTPGPDDYAPCDLGPEPSGMTTWGALLALFR